MIERVLTIAGSDSSGGAGIQADLKTMAALGSYGLSAITAITVQNTQGVFGIQAIDADIVARQIRVVVEDIGVDAVKIGMLFSKPVIQAVKQELTRLEGIPVVLDPVMRAKGGAPLLDPAAEDALRQDLVPLALVVTPNVPEAEALVGFPVRDETDMRRAARTLAHQGVPYVLVKGGHMTGQAARDLLWHEGQEQWLSAPRIATIHTHGTGCTLSSAIAVFLARGQTVPEAVAHAKAYVTGAIEHAPGFGHGNGPLWHHWGQSPWM